MLSGLLYHGVEEWKPKLHLSEARVTPGRIGNVFFFPRASYEKLKNKPKGWFVDTSGGTLPSLR